MEHTIATARPLVQAMLAAGIAPFIWGAPGIGKSDMVRDMASYLDWPLIDIRASQLDPVDVRGIPTVADGLTIWNVPDFLPRADRDGPDGILFLDELNTAGHAVQVALYQLVLDRRIGDYHLPPGWRVIAAGNRQSDRAAAQRLSSALANRFAHVTIRPDYETWHIWATGAGIAPEIVAFLRWQESRGESALHRMPTDDGPAFPSPRTWHRLSDLLATGYTDVMAAANSLVGYGVACEFAAFCEVFRELPSLNDVRSAPETARVPREASAQYAITTAMANNAERADMASFAAYMSRLPIEFQALFFNDATRRDAALAETSAFTKWAVEQQKSRM